LAPENILAVNWGKSRRSAVWCQPQELQAPEPQQPEWTAEHKQVLGLEQLERAAEHKQVLEPAERLLAVQSIPPQFRRRQRQQQAQPIQGHSANNLHPSPGHTNRHDNHANMLVRR
jgi:hypothetical protein